jgi:hypothetical protein
VYRGAFRKAAQAPAAASSPRAALVDARWVLRQLDEQLYFQVFAKPTPAAKRASVHRWTHARYTHHRSDVVGAATL